MSSPGPSSKAADIAARQVESIVDAAQTAAEQITQRAHTDAEARRVAIETELEERRGAIDAEAEKLRLAAANEAEEVRRAAQEEATRVRELANKEAVRVAEQARSEASERVLASERAADAALADAQAMNAGLKRLADSLSDYAERILRDVQAGHKRLRSDLRIASGSSSPMPKARPSQEGTRSRARGAASEIDIPSWVARED